MRWLLVLCLFLAASVPGRAAELIRFSAAMELDSLPSSVASQLLQEAFGRIGRSFEAEFHSANRSLLSSNSGETDGELSRVHDLLQITGGAYPNLIRIEVEMQRLKLVLITHEGAGIRSLDDLAGKSVAYIPGHKIFDATLGARPGVRVVATPDINKAFDLLFMGRIDGVGFGEIAGAHVSARLAALGKQIRMIPIKDVSLYAYIHKRHVALLPDLEAALKDMQADGSFARITARAEAAYVAAMSEDTAAVGAAAPAAQ